MTGRCVSALAVVDKQALENDRTNGNGVNNWAAHKN